MRIIKFRAFDDGKMIYENNILHLKNEDNLVLRLAKFWCNIRNDSHVMQFTGLHDKNGKEIYEGDIIEDTLGRKKLVEYFQDGFWLNASFDGAEWCLRRENSSSKVIGNIYEHRELLTD